MEARKLYEVVGPSCGEADRFRVLIDAKSKRAALWAAWRVAKATRSRWYTEKSRDVHPFHGVEVRKITGREHYDVRNDPGEQIVYA